jgi:hypothetical protein
VLSIGEVPVVIDTVLLESDLPDLLLARDRVETMYLCSLAKTDREGFLFLAVEISSARLSAFRSGLVDLRTVLVEPEMGTHFTGRATAGRPESLTLSALTTEVREEWLPETGFLMTAFADAVSGEQVVEEAISKNAAVIVYGINPPEARGKIPKVNADRLADYIRAFQDLVRHAAKDAIGKMSKEAKRNAPPDPFALEVFGFSGGSFRIHFESKASADLFGGSIIGAAMRRIDELVDLSRLPADEAVEGFKAHRGHTLSSYRHLLKLVTDKEVAFSYQWAEPALTMPQGKGITLDTARAAYAVLNIDETLDRVKFSYVARFTYVRTEPAPQGWGARDDEGEKKSGFVHEDSPSVLNGVTIKSTRYLLTGEERLVSPRTGGAPVLKQFLRQAIPQD